MGGFLQKKIPHSQEADCGGRFNGFFCEEGRFIIRCINTMQGVGQSDFQAGMMDILVKTIRIILESVERRLVMTNYVICNRSVLVIALSV